MKRTVRKKRFRVLAAVEIARASGRDTLSGIFRFIESNPDWQIDLVQSAAEFTPELLLETTNMSVAAIAAETGYCTPSHFANTFRDATGVSPRAWRNQL